MVDYEITDSNQKIYPPTNYNWGAIVYLTYSSKGGRSNPVEEVIWNNDWTPSATIGINGMAMGNADYTMGNYDPNSDNTGSISNSGIPTNDFPNVQPGLAFINFFLPTPTANLRDCDFVRCAGMATFEVDGWHSSNSNVGLGSGRQWTVRGGASCRQGLSFLIYGIASTNAWSGSSEHVSCSNYYAYTPSGRVVISKIP